MAFYRKRYGATEAAPLTQRLKAALGIHAHRFINPDDPDEREWYFVPKTLHPDVLTEIFTYNKVLFVGGFTKLIPTTDGHIIIFDETGESLTPTTSPSHLRLPKLSHLMSLTPEDFFALMRLVHMAKVSMPATYLSLNPPKAGIPNLAVHPLSPFFTLVRTNYTINPDYADKKWTPKAALSTIANLKPTNENQLLAMRYLTAVQNSDLLYFPLDAMLELDLEWEQINDAYCIPPAL